MSAPLTRLPRFRPRADAVGLMVLGVVLLVLGPVLGRREAIAVGLFLLILVLAALALTLVELVLTRRAWERSWIGLAAPRTEDLHGLHQRLEPLDLAVHTRGDSPSGGAGLEVHLPESLRPDDGPSPRSRRLRRLWRRARAGGWTPLRRSTLSLLPRWRGRYELDAVRCSVTGPFGLWTARQRISVPQEAELPVGPRRRPLPADLDRVLLAQVADATGHRRTQRPDDVGLREHTPGDSLHRVHWGATARSGQLMVRAEEPEDRAPVQLIVDRTLGHGERQEHVSPSGHAVSTDEGLEAVVATAAAIESSLRSQTDLHVDVVDHTGDRFDPAEAWTDIYGETSDDRDGWVLRRDAVDGDAVMLLAVVGAATPRLPAAPPRRAAVVLVTETAAAEADRWRAAGWNVLTSVGGDR